jgi:hypothetical protein
MQPLASTHARVTPRRLLTWQATDAPSRPRDDYTGTDIDRPQFHARVYLAEASGTERRWCWVVAEGATIARGDEATLEGAIDASLLACSGWRYSNQRTDLDG